MQNAKFSQLCPNWTWHFCTLWLHSVSNDIKMSWTLYWELRMKHMQQICHSHRVCTLLYSSYISIVHRTSNLILWNCTNAILEIVFFYEFSLKNIYILLPSFTSLFQCGSCFKLKIVQLFCQICHKLKFIYLEIFDLKTCSVLKEIVTYIEGQNRVTSSLKIIKNIYLIV
jgi:hypothetical protein